MSDKRLHTDLATSIKSRIDQLIRRTGYRIVRTDDLPDIGAPTARTIATVRAYTALSPERIVAVIDATKYLERYDIQGAIVECGVWRGGAMMAAARTLLEIGSEPRDIYLFDTFEGMTEPTEFDRDLNGVPAAEQIESVKMAVPIEEVRRNIESTGYPVSHLHLVKGPVEQTVPDLAPDQIALLRLDTDWYESTRHELEHLIPRIPANGVLLIDDYGHWQGARKAVDEFLALFDRPILLARTDSTGRMAIVPGVV